jgi:hypothetical protein
MSVSVAGRQIHRNLVLSESARVVLGLIQGGMEWLEWAIRHPRARYHFVDECALVAAVQTGLHASPLMLLPAFDLTVGPARLMALDPDDLNILAWAKDDDKRVRMIRGDHALVTEAEFARDARILDEWGVGSRLVFQGMGLDDQLAIHALLHPEIPLPRSAEPEEAAEFAVGLAVNPPEFADYYRAYLQYLAASPRCPRRPKERMALVWDAVELLQPLLYDALDCPRVDGQAADWEVALAIEEWLMMGRRLGFSRLSRGVQQVIAHTPFASRDCDEDAAQIVAIYLIGAQMLLGSARLGHRRIGQDGVSSTFALRADAEEGIVALGADGIITLSGYRAWPEPPATPATTKRRK